MSGGLYRIRGMRRRPSSFENLGFARVETQRLRRQGFPEAIFCEGKSTEQVVRIFDALRATGTPTIATRVSETVAAALTRRFPDASYHSSSRLVTANPRGKKSGRLVLVIAAGTADLPVAEEAAVTLETLGRRVTRLFDVGVAGIHRLLAYENLLKKASVCVVCAGMDGALPSVVGGLVSCPVVAVPTSVGYGAHLQGLAPLLTMLNSCAANVSVVNIDNGFGAGIVASLICAK
jgi:pyridinium-3,5-biscarboxylic acid mononucleotide synthase